MSTHNFNKFFYLFNKSRCQINNLIKYLNNKFLDNKNQVYYTLSS